MNNNVRQIGGRKPSIRPEIPKADYCDEISPEAFAKIRESVADINDPNHKRESVSGVDIFGDK